MHIIIPENTYADRAAEREVARRRERLHAAMSLAAWLAACYAASALGAVATRNAESFYNQLSLPWWAPSAGVFGPVWTMLYALMGIAAWMVWRERRADTRHHTLQDTAHNDAEVMSALKLFGAQLAVNAIWSWVFFGWHQGALALFTILVLLALVVVVTIRFYRINQMAGMVLTPYVAWLAYATCLAFVAWRRNPQLL